MLVLSRKDGQSIRIGKNVELFVVGIQGKNVRLGIRAPKDVRIMRSELMESESQDVAYETFQLPSVSTVNTQCGAY